MKELTIVVNKNRLLEQLKEYKERFVKSYEALLKAYEKKAKKYQEKYSVYLEKVKARKVKDDYREQPAPPPKPQDRTKDYDFYISMIEAHTKATIELSEADYRKLWMDKWEWIDRHIQNLEAYADSDASVNAMLALYSA